MKLEVIVHLGVHKTATTYIQSSLLRNKKHLEDNRIAYIPLRDMRSGITSSITEESVYASEIRNFLFTKIDIEKYDRIIISDENIIGGTNDIFSQSNLYPRGHKNVEKIKEVFKDCNLKFLLAIRNYSDFYPSMYCEFLRHHEKFITFRHYISTFNYLKYSWPYLIESIVRPTKEHPISIMQLEQLSEVEDKLFQYFTGSSEVFISPAPKKDSRKSYKAKTVQMMDVLNKELDGKYLIKFINAIDKVNLKQGQVKKFSPWNSSELSFFQEKYEQDLAYLRKQFDFI